MRTLRHTLGRVGAAGAATLLGVAGLGAAGLITASPAAAATVSLNFAFDGPTGYSAVTTAGDWSASSASVAAGAQVTLTSAPGTQTVPTTNSGVSVNYIDDIVQYYPIPAGTTYVSATASGSVSFTPAGSTTATTSPRTITYCPTTTSTGCTAQATSATFLGSTPAPYLELGTQSGTQFTAGGSLTIPSVSVVLATSASAGGTTVNWVQTEFDTTSNVTISSTALNVTVLGYPTATALTSTQSTPPALLSPPPTLASFSIVGPNLTVTNTPPINIPGTGSLTINVAGSNWPASITAGTLTWSGGVGANTDTGTFTTSTTGALTGTIPLSTAEQTSTSQSAITLTLTAVGGGDTIATTVTVNPYQSFLTQCQIATGSCTINQTINATVIGTVLTLSEVQTGPANPDNKTVVLSPVTLGIGTGTNNQQFDQAQGLLNTVVVSDDRGTLGGWDVTGQLGGDFTNTASVGPTADNVIPADFLTWQPAVALETAGSLPANNANTPGCPTQTTPPTGYPSCTGPSGLPVPLSGTSQGTAGSAGVNGTGAGTGGVSSTPAEVTAGPTAVLNNPAGSAAALCQTASGTSPGGGGGFLCEAGLSLAIPPYVAAGTYTATMNIVVTGF